ncbi:hypothetical protein [Micromonospora sp. NPDC048830]|uniref:hypothetical protein n=1 Tax=Micromonospora sp. NPDC048830 TaxID=3364257 RepID=UPI003721134C
MLRKLGMATILALTTALAALSAPGAASAGEQATGAPNSNVTYWVEQNPPPPSDRALKAAAEMQKSVTPLASGGGCKLYGGVQPCISWTNNTLKGDFYINSWSGAVYYGTARVYINVNGTNHYKYTTVTDHLGAYPVAQHATAAGSSGYAYTIVDTFNQNGSVIGGGISPFQYWP